MAVESKTTELQKNNQKVGAGISTWPEAGKARTDITEMFGFVPTFMENFVDQTLPGIWSETKSLYFNPQTALEQKVKGLIGIAVGAQIPCEFVSYFNKIGTSAEGVTRQEQLEAVFMSAITRHWSTVLNGLQLDHAEFRKEADQIMAYVKKMMTESAGMVPPEEMFLVRPTTAEEAYVDMKKTLGLVPKFFQMFPKEGIAGAWSEFKGLQLNPHTQLNGKQKELIGLAVAAQIPCEYCIYFHRSAALLNGATENEISEAISNAALSRHWSTYLHGPHIDITTFKREADQMIAYVHQRRLQS